MFGLFVCAEVEMPKFSPKHKTTKAKKPAKFVLFFFIGNDFTSNDIFLKERLKKWHSKINFRMPKFSRRERNENLFYAEQNVYVVLRNLQIESYFGGVARDFGAINHPHVNLFVRAF